MSGLPRGVVQGRRAACPWHPAADRGVGVSLFVGGRSASLCEGHAGQEYRWAVEGYGEGDGGGRRQASGAGGQGKFLDVFPYVARKEAAWRILPIC